MDLYLSEPDKKDSLDRRLRNALHLLVAADAQTNPSLQLALQMTALEALLTHKNDSAGITAKLAERAATLLEPRKENRVQAEKFVTRLYGHRSDVLHGEKLEDAGAYAQNSRLMVQHAFLAVFDWQSFRRKASLGPDDPDAFFRELHNHFALGQPITGIVEARCVSLWRT
jgi:hypothetical protein